TRRRVEPASGEVDGLWAHNLDPNSAGTVHHQEIWAFTWRVSCTKLLVPETVSDERLRYARPKLLFWARRKFARELGVGQPAIHETFARAREVLTHGDPAWMLAG